jgi:hypothetical protein
MKKNAYYEKPSDKMRRRVRNSMKRISRESRERKER